MTISFHGIQRPFDQILIVVDIFQKSADLQSTFLHTLHQFSRNFLGTKGGCLHVKNAKSGSFEEILHGLSGEKPQMVSVENPGIDVLPAPLQ